MLIKPNGRVSLEMDDNGVAQLRLTRPEKLNALDQPMFEALIEAGFVLAETRGLRAVVIAGEGRAFCAGIDTARLQGNPADESPDYTVRTHGDANVFQQAAMQWRDLPVPVVAAIHGVCFGGGLQIASGADIRIAAPDARLSIMEMKWGLVPDMGGYALWRGLVRDDLLRDLIYTNRVFSGEEGVDLGIVTHADPDPLARAMRLAAEIASRSPHAIRSAKRLANRAREATTAELLQAESREQHALKGSRNQSEAVASQLEKRPADFVDP